MTRKAKTGEVGAPHNKAQELAQDTEAEIFGDGGATALPVTEVTSADEQAGLATVPADQIAHEPAYVDEHTLMPEQTNERVFQGAVADVARETQPEQTVSVPLSVLETMQRQIADLQSANGDQIIDPLNMDARKKLINATFYSTDDGKQWLVTDMKERVFPNGTRAKVYQDGVDQDKKPVYKSLIEMANVETGEVIDLEVIYDNFIKLSTPVQTEAIRTNERNVDMTPREETVEVASYVEQGGYVKRQGSGVRVRASVVGKVHSFVVNFGGREFTLSSDVINIK